MSIKKTVADLVIEMLVRQGVRRIYGYLGASVVPLLQSLESNGGIHFVLCRNEANASLAASADAKFTGTLGVCVATSGPGASNLITGLLDAQSDRAPVLALTGDLPSHKCGRPTEFQELDQTRLFSILGSTSMVAHPEAAAPLLAAAIGTAVSDRHCVHVCIPSDIQRVELRPEIFDAGLAVLPIVPLRETLPGRFVPSLFEDVAKLLVGLVSSEDPGHGVAIVAGPRTASCGEEIERLANLIHAPIISTLDAKVAHSPFLSPFASSLTSLASRGKLKGAISDKHPLSVGILGIFGSPAFSISQEALAGVKLIVAIGLSNPSPFAADTEGLQIRDLVTIRSHFSASGHLYFRSMHTVIGPIGQAVTRICEAVEKITFQPGEPQKNLVATMQEKKQEFYRAFEVESSKPSDTFAHPARLLAVLSHVLEERARLGKDKTVLIPDVGDNTVWTALFLRMHNRERIVNSTGQGVMGWAVPASVATCLASPNSTVLAIAGDGGLMMSVQELATAVQEKASFVFVVFVNSALRRVVGSPFTKLSNRPDYAKLAESFGARGMSIRGNDEAVMLATLQAAFALADLKNGPVLVDVNIDPEIGAPMSSWKATGHAPLAFH